MRKVTALSATIRSAGLRTRVPLQTSTITASYACVASTASGLLRPTPTRLASFDLFHEMNASEEVADNNTHTSNASQGTSSSSSASSAAIATRRTATTSYKTLPPPPPPTSILIRNLPPQWGVTEVTTFVMDCLGSDGCPMDLPESFINEYAAAVEATERAVAEAEENGENDDTPKRHYHRAISSSMSPTTFGMVQSATDGYGISIEDSQWFPLKKVKLFYSAKKGTSLRRAKVTFNPYPNMTGVIAPIRADGQHSVGLVSEQGGAKHPLVVKMLRVDPEQITPGINDGNKKMLRRMEGGASGPLSGTGLVEVSLYKEKAAAPELHPNDPTQWLDRDRILWEANHPEEALASLDIDRFLMSQDLLYDFKRMKQEQYVSRSQIARGEGIKVASFRGGKRAAALQGEEEDATLGLGQPDTVGIGSEVGRGAPLNVIGTSVPYIDRFSK